MGFVPENEEEVRLTMKMIIFAFILLTATMSWATTTQINCKSVKGSKISSEVSIEDTDHDAGKSSATLQYGQYKFTPAMGMIAEAVLRDDYIHLYQRNPEFKGFFGKTYRWYKLVVKSQGFFAFLFLNEADLSKSLVTVPESTLVEVNCTKK